MAQLNFEIKMPISQQWNTVELLRAAILNCLTVIFQNLNYCNSVSIVVGELLENAIKYGDWTKSNSLPFTLRVFGDEAGVTIEVTNPVKDDSPHLTELQRTVEWIQGFETPAQAFAARMQALASHASRGGDPISQLGLARIAYEGDCRLKVIHGQDLACVQAFIKTDVAV